MKPDTHLCLVSAQATPNLTPALDPAVAPRRVILLTTDGMARQADWLESVLKPRGIRIDRWAIDDPWNIEHIQERVLQLLEREGESVASRNLALNATGGTKPMSIAAYEAFRAWDLPIFYVHPELDRLVWMHPAGAAPHPLDNRIRLDAFLAAHGAAVEGEPLNAVGDRRLLTLTTELVARVAELGKALATLNYLAAQADNRALRSHDRLSDVKADRVVLELVERFAAAGLLRQVEGHLHFADEEARFFVNGGWLELHAFAAVQQLRHDEPRIQDIGRSVKVHREQRGRRIPNELDVAFLADNRLYLIECKTRGWKKSPADAETPGGEALYRLDTLKDLLGGLQARAMLISYRDLPPQHRQRAADLGIAVCAGEQIRRLDEHIRRWVR